MTQAAKQLHLTQSGVSQQVKALEEALDITLFDRINRRIIPTTEAEILYSECSKHLDDLEGAITKISNKNNELIGKVKIGRSASISLVKLIGQVAEFQKANPKVRVIFKVGSNKELADELNKGNIDFAFMDRHFEDLPFSYQILGKEHLKLWSKKSFKKQDFDSVAAQNFIMNQRGHPLLNQWFDENFNKIPSELNIKAASMDSSIRLFMTNEQMGAALLTSRVAAIAGLEEALERQTPIVRPVYLIKLKNRSLSDCASACNKWLIQGENEST